MKIKILCISVLALCLLPLLEVKAQQPSSAGDSEVTFKKSKMTMFEGKKAKDIQVELAFVAKSKLVVRKAGAPVIEVPYTAIQRVTYEYSQRRRIGEGAVVMVFSPAAGAVMMFVKTKTHWLAVEYSQGDLPKTLVVQLDKKEYEQVLTTAEAEMGRKVERIEGGGGIANPTAGSHDLSETVDYPLEKVTAAAKAAMEEHGCLVKTEKTGQLECKRPFGQKVAGSFGGENIKIKLAAEGSRTKVAIETDKTFRGGAYQKNWSKPVFDSMMKRLTAARKDSPAKLQP